MKIKKNSLPNRKGSILAYSLIILGMMLAIATSLSVSTIIEKKSASATEFSTQALQTADSGVQMALKKINTNLDVAINNNANFGLVGCDDSGSTTAATIPAQTIDKAGEYNLSFFKADGTTPVFCNAKAKEIELIKATGSFRDTVRAVSVSIGIPDEAQTAMKNIVNAIVAARTNTAKVTLGVTGTGCSEWDCYFSRPPLLDLRGISDSCFTRWQLTLVNIGNAASLGASLSVDYARDPWGSPYQLDENEAEGSIPNCTRDRLFSAGPDGIRGTADDIQSEPIPFYQTVACGV